MKRLLRIVIFTLLLTSISALAFNIKSVKAAPEMIYVDDDNTTGPWNGTKMNPYQNITNALEHASDNDTIHVYSGTYREHVLVNKSVSIIGENKTTTILDGGGQNRTIINVIKPYVTIAGFTIQNAADDNLAYGISVSKTENVTIRNNIIATGRYGILLHLSSHCRVYANNVSDSYYCGIGLQGTPSQGARNNTFIGNSIIDNQVGISLNQSSNNIVSWNSIVTNDYGIHFGLSVESNRFYHNSLINNTHQVWLDVTGYVNYWDDGYPSGGNYWSDCNGTDLYSGPHQNLTGGDGIRDTPYIIDDTNQDNYPFLTPISLMPWDITGPAGEIPDGKCDMRDIGLVARHFGQSVPPALVACDLTGPTYLEPDGKIDMRDIGLVARHFGETAP